MVFLHVIEASATGTLSMANMLVRSQIDSGSEVHVVYSPRPETPDNIHDFFGLGVVVHELDMSSPKGLLVAFFKLRFLVKKLSPNVVVLHSSFAGFVGRLSSLFLGRKIRYFYIPHCISFMRKDINRIKKTAFIFFEWLASIKRCVYLACSESEQKVIRRYVPFRDCLLVENAVKMPDICRQNDSTKKVVITVGGVRPQKGPLEYAELARLSFSRIPKIEFLWIGDGDTELKKALIDAGVTVTGWLERDEVFSLLSSASVYVSTSHWEGMPVSVIEAMYSRLPIIASRCAGNIDVIKHNNNGWLFDSPSEACDQLERVLESADISSQFSLHAYKDACSRFSPERYFKSMNSIMSLNK